MSSRLGEDPKITRLWPIRESTSFDNSMGILDLEELEDRLTP
jgi:23S rRNA maturation mini-RNase III